jgi:hypothetical protein
VILVSPELLERLRELSLVDPDVLVGRLRTDDALAVMGAYVGDLEDALAEARATLREAQRSMSAATDPLALLDLGSERRTRAGDEAFADAAARVARRAADRRELARLEEAVRGVMGRLLEADRRWVAMGGR